MNTVGIKDLFVERAEDLTELQSFECGNRLMDDFLHSYLAECSAAHFCTVYFVRLERNGELAAIFALSFDSVTLNEDDFDDMRIGAAGTGLPQMNANFRERFEQKYSYPALEITYLAVHKKYQHLKIGSVLVDTIDGMAKQQRLAGCVFLTVNALHTPAYSARGFYERNGFALLTATPTMDVWPMYRTLWQDDDEPASDDAN